MRILAARAWLVDGWHSDVAITVEAGRITAIERHAAYLPGDTTTDTLLPALANLHSHSFQRAMAGMTEFRAAGQDSFWTWRTLMYRFLEYLMPDHIEAIAALAFMEMQEAGYAAVGEFHYVHNRTGGRRYDDPAELTHRIFAAASATGIGLTHLPVLYTYGGVGKAPLTGGQLRFGNDVDGFTRLVEAAKSTLPGLPDDTRIGIAPHSLRATAPDELAAVLTSHAGCPVHMHIAEQPKEVADIMESLGARPVEWVLANADVGAHWCLIHATHMTPAETAGLAASGAVAGLCPITEANLGDGPFDGPAYLDGGGRFGVGTDSNVRISMFEELRMLEYSQRLLHLSRNVMVRGAGSVGKTLYLGAAQGGAQVLGRTSGAIAVGNLADLMAVDSAHPQLCGLSPDQLFDGLCFAAGSEVVTDVWSAGRYMVRGGRHIRRDRIVVDYQATMADLMRLMRA